MSFPSSPRDRDVRQSGRKFPAALVGDMPSKNFALPFVHHLTIPKNTSADDPTEYTMSLPVGLIKRLWIEFPEGCKGLARVQIWRRVYQIFPQPEGVWFYSDDSIYDFNFTHSVHNEPYEVILRGYNLDDTFEHTPTFAFEMTGLVEDLPPQLQSFFDTLKGSV